MPTLKNTTPLLGGKFYHIYNRGVNRQTIFFTEQHYQLFLNLMSKYLLTHCHILSYSLLPNHFHLILKIKDAIYNEDDTIDNEVIIGQMFSKQLQKLMIAYAMKVNKQEQRTGALFGSRFKRIEIADDDYLKYLIFYCHYNPEKHRYCNSFKDYKFHSYNAIISQNKSKIARQFVLELFNGLEAFINFHHYIHEERKLLILED